jgi:hypothetical protein
VVDGILHRERQLAVGAIDGAERRVDEMSDLAMPAGFEDVDEADQVALYVGLRILSE